MRRFLKILLFLLIAVGIAIGSVLTIRGATPSGKIKVPTGYNQTGSGKPVAWWKMDEASWNGTAGEVKDSSGTNHGTAVNGANTTSTASTTIAIGSPENLLNPGKICWWNGLNYTVEYYGYDALTKTVATSTICN